MGDIEKALNVLKALSDSTRLRIVYFLLDGEKCICQIIPYVKRSQPTVSIQLSKLRRFGIVRSRKEGRQVYYRISNYRVCDVFKILGFEKGKILKKKCCMERGE
jgi:ArsR family transcriptional regulator